MGVKWLGVESHEGRGKEGEGFVDGRGARGCASVCVVSDARSLARDDVSG